MYTRLKHKISNAGITDESAVDGQCNAGYERSLVTEKESRRAMKVARLAEFAHRSFCENLSASGGRSLAVFFHHQEAVLIRNEKAGSKGVYANTHRS